MIDTDALLFGSPSWDEVVEFWRRRSFDEETYLVQAIKRHLRTDEQRQALADADISIEDMLNGRVSGAAGQALRDRVFGEWNAKLGFRAFGF